MKMQEAIQQRHAVRQYLDKPIAVDVIAKLNDAISMCNRESGLHIQLVTNEPEAFCGMMARYGKFSGVQNYVTLIGKKSPVLEEKVGYYGEHIAIAAQQLGLNTCWVAMTFRKGVSKRRCSIEKGEKLVCVLALGYGATPGIAHKSKPMEQLTDVPIDQMPAWFRQGMECAMLAPTAMNQQKFLVLQKEERVIVKSLGGFYAKVELGIVRYHFEVGSGRLAYSAVSQE